MQIGLQNDEIDAVWQQYPQASVHGIRQGRGANKMNWIVDPAAY